jgi:RNA polymerase sigma-70 factor, ECF subfamily
MTEAPHHAGPVDPDVAVVERFVRDVLAQATQSEATSLEVMLPAVYAELRTLASYLLRGERWARTLGPTALAHEAYLRLARETRSEVQNRSHLLAVAATAMRRVIIDYARARRAVKRGGGAAPVTLSESLVDAGGRPVDLIDLHRALDRLAEEHPRKVRIVEMIYFAGFTPEEAAAALDLSERTVLRDWKFAKAWLWRSLNAGGSSRPDED